MSLSSHKTEIRDWLILAEDGRHVLLGRNSDPTEQEISLAANALAVQNIGGWLVIGFGNYYQKTPYNLEKIREISACKVPWDIAENLFHKIRNNI